MKAKLLGVALAVCVLLLAASFLFAGSGYRTLHAASGSGIVFDSRNHTPIYERKDAVTGAIREFNASMQFQSYSTKGFPNLFQTGPVNTGVRAELSGSVLALIVGATSAAGYDPFIVTSAYDGSKPHTMTVKIDRTNHVVVMFDGMEVINTTRPDLNYTLSDVAVGAGLSATRPFEGRITDFSYSYAYYAPSTMPKVFFWVRIALGLALLTFLSLLLRGSNINLSKLLPDVAEPEED